LYDILVTLAVLELVVLELKCVHFFKPEEHTPLLLAGAQLPPVFKHALVGLQSEYCEQSTLLLVLVLSAKHSLLPL